MRRFFAIVALLLLGIACDKDEAFTCKVVDSEATNITQTTATLEATINASDFGKVERVGFMVGDDFYRAELGRVFSVVVDGLKPNTEYEYRIMIYALGDVWNKEGGKFRTLSEGEEPTPEPAKEAKVVFNELCGNKVEWGGNPANKFIELYNAGEGDGNLAGWTIRKYAADATDVAGKYNVVWEGPENTTIAAGAYIVLGADATDYADGFTAGLSAKKGVKFELVDAAGNVVDKFIRGEDADPFGEEGLSENKEASYSRVPNGTGSFAYAVPTPGAANGEKTGDIEHK